MLSHFVAKEQRRKLVNCYMLTSDTVVNLTRFKSSSVSYSRSVTSATDDPEDSGAPFRRKLEPAFVSDASLVSTSFSSCRACLRNESHETEGCEGNRDDKSCSSS